MFATMQSNSLQLNLYSTDTTGWNKIKYWFAYLQKVFSAKERKRLSFPLPYNSIPTHSAIDFGSIRGVPYMIEAGSFEVKISVKYSPKFSFQFDAPLEIQESVLDWLREKFLHKQYGYIQLLSFLKRWIVGWFKEDSRRTGVLFTSGTICTELAYWYLYKICVEMKWIEEIKFIEQYNSNLVYPIDILVIAEYLQKKGRGILVIC